MRWIDPPGGRPWALIGLCGASLVLNIVLGAKLASSPDEPETISSVIVETPATEPVAGEMLEEVAAPAPEIPAGSHVVHASVQHSLARTFQKALPDDDADGVSAVYARLFFWDLDLRRDLQKGDDLAVLYSLTGDQIDMPAATYRSSKLGRTLTAYRFTATGDAFASWWSADGEETSYRLQASPLRDYEQVTSLIKDRPSHKGMDFKTPVGTDVYVPKAGTVKRTDWNWKYNGNCVEVRYTDGTMARFLHLSETAVAVGAKLGAGDRLGASGNTGRSTAPHLHYELEKSGKVVDPVDYHGVERRTLPAGDLEAFGAEVARLDRLLSSES